MGLAELSGILWRERQLLEMLAFKLNEEQLLLDAGEARWLVHASREIEVILDELKQAELVRAVEAAILGTELGLGSTPTLRALLETADEPWRTVLNGHRDALLRANDEVSSLAEANRALLSTGQEAVNQTLSWLGEQLPATNASASSGAQR